MLKKECLFLKCSQLLKLHLYQIGKAQIMPMVAARLVQQQFQYNIHVTAFCNYW